jgi:hypothetical protein
MLDNGGRYPLHPEHLSIPASCRPQPAYYRASAVASLPARHHAYSTSTSSSTLGCPQLHHPAQPPHCPLDFLVQRPNHPSCPIGKRKSEVGWCAVLCRQFHPVCRLLGDDLGRLGVGLALDLHKVHAAREPARVEPRGVLTLFEPVRRHPCRQPAAYVVQLDGNDALS